MMLTGRDTPGKRDRDLSPADRKAIARVLNERKTEARFTEWIKIKKGKEKEEDSLLLITKHDVIFFNNSKNPKVSKKAHVLDVERIYSSSPNNVVITIREGEKQVLVENDLVTPQTDEIITLIRQLRINIYPAMLTDPLVLTTEPPTRIVKVSAPVSPLCGGFAETYSALCVYYNKEAAESIIYKISVVLSSNNIPEFNLVEFQWSVLVHAEVIRPLLQSLWYNPHFTSFSTREFKLTLEEHDLVAQIFARNTFITKVDLTSSKLLPESVIKLAECLEKNSETCVEELYLSDNQVEDKGVIALGSALVSHKRGLQHLHMANCGISPKGFGSFFNSLKKNFQMYNSLQSFDISGNKLDVEGSNGLSSWIAGKNKLKSLEMASSGPLWEKIFSAIKKGCPELNNMNISGNSLLQKDAEGLCSMLKSSKTLKKLTVNDTVLTSEIANKILLELSTNTKLKDLNLSMCANKLSLNICSVVTQLVTENHLKNLDTLILDDNDLGDEGIENLCLGLAPNGTLKFLSIKGNWTKGMNKARSRAISALIRLVTKANSVLHTLLLSGNKNGHLEAEIIPVLQHLSNNKSLTRLDISGHFMGNNGATALSKLIQTNKSLTWIEWDDNNTTLPGFENILKGLEYNFSIKKMPPPWNDIKNSPEPEVHQVITNIQMKIGSNLVPGRSRVKAAAALMSVNVGDRDLLDKLRYKLRQTPDEDGSLNEILALAENSDLILSNISALQSSMHYDLKQKIIQQFNTLAPILQENIQEEHDRLCMKVTGQVRDKFRSIDDDDFSLFTSEISEVKPLNVDDLQRMLISFSAEEISELMKDSLNSMVESATAFCCKKLNEKIQKVVGVNETQIEASKSKKKALGLF